MNRDAPDRATDTEMTARRETVRLGVRRTIRAIGSIIAVVLALGVAMVVASYRAHQHQLRAESAETAATERLWNSYLAQARAERLSSEAGHRAAALAAVSNAAAIRPSPELRCEAIASLALRDLERVKTWPLKPGAYGFYFDPGLDHYVVSYSRQTLSLYRFDDNSHVRDFVATDAGLGTNATVREFMFSRTGRFVAMYYSTGVAVL